MITVIDEEWYWLRVLSRQLAQEPNAYEVFAEVIIPSFVGVGTLALAAASLYIAAQSQRTAKAAVEAAREANDIAQHQYHDEMDRAERSERRVISAAISEWFGTASLAAFREQEWLKEKSVSRVFDEMDRLVRVYQDDSLTKFIRQLHVRIFEFEELVKQSGLDRNLVADTMVRLWASTGRDLEAWQGDPSYFHDQQVAEADAADARESKRETDERP